MSYRLIAIAAMIAVMGIPQARADDVSCVKMPCLGKCISKEEAEGKIFPAYCMAQSSCYQAAECTQLEDGKCGWKETPELKACLAAPHQPGNGLVRPMPPLQ